MDSKIYVITHKKVNEINEPGYTTLLVGAIKNNTFPNNYLHDDERDNISELNDSYCELTGLYWIWKNADSRIVGLVHYRRLFANLKCHFDFIGRHIVFSKKKPYEILSIEEATSRLKNADIIVKKSEFRFQTVKSIFINQIGGDLYERIEKTINQTCPEYVKEFNRVCNSHSHFNCNMFIGRKIIIDEYCEWLFPILKSIDDSYKKDSGDRYHNREIGYISELLLRVWLDYNNINYITSLVVFTEDPMIANGVLSPKEFVHFLVNRTLKKLRGQKKLMNQNLAIWNSIKTYISSEIKDRNALGISFSLYNKTHSVKDLKKYQSIHKGKKCYVVGTGPSLKIGDLEMLRGQICFGVNTLFKIFDKTTWRPDYYCIIDPKTYANIKEKLDENQVKNIFIAQNRMKNGFNKETCIPFNLECSSFYKIGLKNHLELLRFSDDITKQVYDGASVMYAALQIAAYMGFKKIYLLGADCNYDSKMLHAGELGYSADYKYNWTRQTGLTMIEGFKVAKKYADEHGIEIYNATRGGMLEVFPRVILEDVVN